MTVAIFDVDNTLVKGSTTLHAAVALINAGIIEPKGIGRAIWEQFLYRVSRNEPELASVHRRVLQAINGVPIKLIEEVMDDVASRILESYLYKETRDMLQKHIICGDQVWLATAGPATLAESMAYKLGATGAVGTKVSIDKGICNGALEGSLVHGIEKLKAIHSLSDSLKWDRNKITVYSDSIRDLPLLKFAAFPNAVNPDKKLRIIAKENNWPIHDIITRSTLFRSGIAGFGAVRILTSINRNAK